jgi:hypothetical protein
MNDREYVRDTRKVLPFVRRTQFEREFDEHDVELRLQELASFVGSLMDASCVGLLTKDNPRRAAIEELAVKQSSLCWIVRVAKRSEDSVRERLWRDVEKAVTGLEKLADAIRGSSVISAAR